MAAGAPSVAIAVLVMSMILTAKRQTPGRGTEAAQRRALPPVSSPYFGQTASTPPATAIATTQ